LGDVGGVEHAYVRLRFLNIHGVCRVRKVLVGSRVFLFIGTIGLPA
jgi:hypothetical protein